jgi:hypothetical protein
MEVHIKFHKGEEPIDGGRSISEKQGKELGYIVNKLSSTLLGKKCSNKDSRQQALICPKALVSVNPS